MEAKGVTFSYDKKTSLLQSVDCEIEPGKITTIIGPNGSGKSTLLGVMAGNYVPQSGQVMLDGKALQQYKPKELAKKLAVVHQQNEAPYDMTVENLVRYGRLPYQTMFSKNSEEDDEAVAWALDCTGLVTKQEKAIENLSGGERQRVWIAMALAQKTPVLFLDEPTTFLDLYYQLEILELIRKLNIEYHLTIAMVLHDINQAIAYSDRLIVMKDGRIVVSGEPRELVTKELIRSIYGVEVAVIEDPEAGLFILPLGI